MFLRFNISWLFISIFFCGFLKTFAQDIPIQTHFMFKTESGFGFMDSLGNVIVEPIYHFADEYKDGYSIVRKIEGDKKYGTKTDALIDEKGNVVVPFANQALQNLGNELVLIRKGRNQKILNLKSNSSISCPDCILGYKKDLNWIIWHHGGKRGLAHKMDIYDVDSNLLFQLKGKYLKRMYNISPGSEPARPLDYLCLQIENVAQRLHNIYNLRGELILDSVECFSDFYDGVGNYGKNGVYAHLDTTMKELISFEKGYKSIAYLSGRTNKDKLYCASNGVFSIVVNSKGEKMLPQEYPANIKLFNDGQGYFDKDTEETFFIKENGETVKLDPKLTIDRAFIPKNQERNWILVRDSVYKFGVLDNNLEVRIPVVYDKLHLVKNNDIIFFKNDSSGYMDHDGNVLRSLNQEWVSNIINGYGMVAIKVYGKTREELPCAQFVFKQDESYAMQYAYVDSLGQRINNQTYDWAYPFVGELAKAMKDCGFVFINKKGIPTQFDSLKVQSDFNGDFVIVYGAKGKFGLFHKSRGLIIPCKFDEIKTTDGALIRQRIYHKTEKSRNLANTQQVPKIENGFIWVKKGEYWGIYSASGQEILEPKYLSIRLTRDSSFFVVHNKETYIGLFDLKGNTVLEPKYDYLSPKSLNGYYRLIEKENFYILTEKGRLISPKL